MPQSSFTPYRLRAARSDDCPQLADLYAANLPDDLPCQLGRRFLTRLFNLILSAPATVVTVAEQEDRLIGFCVISRSRQSINRSLLPSLAVALLLRPLVLAQIVLQCLKPSFLKSLFGEPDRRTAGWREVYLIAVSDAVRGRGLGRQLMTEALTVGPAEIPCMAKTMDKGAAVFYQSVGFMPFGEEKRGSRTLIVLALKGDQ